MPTTEIIVFYYLGGIFFALASAKAGIDIVLKLAELVKKGQ